MGCACNEKKPEPKKPMNLVTPNENKGLSTAYIVAIVLSIFAILMIAFLILQWYRKRNRPLIVNVDKKRHG